MLSLKTQASYSRIVGVEGKVGRIYNFTEDVAICHIIVGGALLWWQYNLGNAGLDYPLKLGLDKFMNSPATLFMAGWASFTI